MNSFYKSLTTASLVTALSFCLLDVSMGHGGVFRGPSYSGAGPGPGVRPKGGGGPRATGAGARGPITGAPTTGGSGPSAGGAPATTGGSIDLTLSPTHWSHWWGFNKDAYLNLRARIHADESQTGDTGFYLGDGAADHSDKRLRPTDYTIHNKVVPALVKALKTETNQNIITGCMIALAKIGSQEPRVRGVELDEVLKEFLSDGNQEIAETAALSLGILANDSSVEFLTELLRDSKAGRKAIGKGEVNYRRRAFAAYGLALIGANSTNELVRQNVVRVLSEVLDSTKSSTRDIKVACLIGIGLVPLQTLETPPSDSRSNPSPSASRMAQIDYLHRYFLDFRRNHSMVRAHAPRAITRLLNGLPETRAEELKNLIAKDLLVTIGKHTSANSKSEIQQSAVLALGQIGDCDEDKIDEQIRKTLLAIKRNLSDRQARFFATIALGQIGGRDGTTGDSAPGRKQISSALTSALLKGNDLGRWAGMGIGVMGRGLSDANHPLPRELGFALRSELEKAKSADDVGAFSIAAGMMRDLDSNQILLNKLDRMSQDDARGYAAVSLGLLNQRESIPPIRVVVRESKYRPELLKQAAIALGLLGDKELVPELVEMLSEAKSLSAQASIASALGFIGDRRSIDPLISMLGDDSLTGSARGFAAAALGIVADKEDLAWNSKIAADLNYRAATETLNSGDASTGILNIL